jgi:hypothetical protein
MDGLKKIQGLCWMDVMNTKMEIKMLAPCGIFCGVCPMYTRRPRMCGGCNSNRGFARLERKLCGIQKCCRNQGISRCSECAELETCARLEEFCKWDSFVSHSPARENLVLLKQQGEAGFLKIISERISSGTYPPVLRKFTMTPGRLIRLMMPPFRPGKNHPV